MRKIFCILNATDGYLDTSKLLLYYKIFGNGENNTQSNRPLPLAGTAVVGITKLIYIEEYEYGPGDE